MNLQITTQQDQPLDWFKSYPISENSSLSSLTTSGIQTLDFLKPILKDFYPGSIINSTITNEPTIKNNYSLLIQTIATKKPKFITDIILSLNPHTTDINKIPFNILLSTTKNWLTQFTNTLFHKINYKQLFNSHYFIPPYSIKK